MLLRAVHEHMNFYTATIHQECALACMWLASAAACWMMSHGVAALVEAGSSVLQKTNVLAPLLRCRTGSFQVLVKAFVVTNY